MKKIASITILCITMISATFGQWSIQNQKQEFRQFSEKFDILTKDNLNIKMTYVRGYKLRKDLPWKSLIVDFLEDYQNVISSVPEYEDFKINYTQNKSLVVEEIKGIKVFNVADDSSSIVKSNICRLQGRVITIEIEITTLENILKTDYVSIIEDAVKNYKRGPYLLSSSYIFYNAKTSETKRREKPSQLFSYGAGGKWGFFRSLPYLELYGRAGYSLDAKNFIYLKGSSFQTYTVESRDPLWWLMPIIGYEWRTGEGDSMVGYGMEFGYTPTGGFSSDSPLIKGGFILNLNDRSILDLSVFGSNDEGALGFSFSGINITSTSRF